MASIDVATPMLFLDNAAITVSGGTAVGSRTWDTGKLTMSDRDETLIIEIDIGKLGIDLSKGDNVTAAVFHATAESERGMWAKPTADFGYYNSSGSKVSIGSGEVGYKNIPLDLDFDGSITDCVVDGKLKLYVTAHNNIAANYTYCYFSDIYIYLRYNRNVYTVTVTASPEEFGSVKMTPQVMQVPQGESRILTATPNVGYKFVKWQDGNTDNPRTVTVTSDKTYTAYFEVNTNIYRSTKKQIAYKGTKGVGKVAVYKSTKKIYG